MLFDDKKISEIKYLIKNEIIVEKGWNNILNHVSELDEKYIAESIEKVNIYKERAKKFGGTKHFTLGNFIRILSQKALILSFVFKITDEEIYFLRANKLINIICEIDNWVFQGILNNWDSDLWTADIGVNLAMSFELIFDRLSQEEKKILKDNLYNKSFCPLYNEWLDYENRIHTLDTMGHNWWSVCVSGCGVVALIIKDRIPDYDFHIKNIADGLKEWFNYKGNVLHNKKANFGIDGDFIEFAGYFDYALSNFVIFESLYSKEYNNSFKSIDFYNKIADYYLITSSYTQERGLKAINFGDVSSTTRTSLFLDYVPLYFANMCKSKTLFLKYNELIGFPFSPFSFLFYPVDVRDFEEFTPMELVVYRHSGYLFMNNKDRDFSFVIKAGESWNHNHLDVGSFVINYKNNEYIKDSGTCTYSKEEYNTYYKMPKAHNVILFNGQGQCEDMLYHGTKFDGNFPVCLCDENYKYVLCDATGAYANIYERFFRHIIAVDDFYILVDDIFTYSEGDLEFLLHCGGKIDIHDNKISVDDTLLCYSLYPKDSKIELKDGFAQEIKEHVTDEGYLPKEKYISISTKTDSNRRKKFISVFTPNKNCKIEISGKDDIKEILIKSNNKIHRIICNFTADGRVMHKNSIIEYNNIKTDAFLVYFCENENMEIEKAAIHFGGFLKYKDEIYYSGLTRTDKVLKGE